MTASETFPSDIPLVVTTRGGLPENVHRGRISVVSAGGERVESRGDVDAPAFFRSAAKPLQAIAPLLGGIAERFGLEERHLALMGASHRGYPEQIAALEEMLARTGVPEEALAFRASKPQHNISRDAWAQRGGVPRKLYHTCAGKHLGMLALCRAQGWPLEGYIEPEHPAQREIVRRVRNWAGAGEAESAVGRDGCGLPVLAVPMWRIALSYARLACPDEAPDAEAASAAARVVRAMNRHPDLVEGPGRLASMLLADDNVVAKSGAQGLFAIGLRRERLGIAVHLSDGSEMSWAPVVIALLKRFGGVSGETMARLEAAFPAEIRNDVGAETGAKAVVF